MEHLVEVVNGHTYSSLVAEATRRIQAVLDARASALDAARAIAEVSSLIAQLFGAAQGDRPR